MVLSSLKNRLQRRFKKLNLPPKSAKRYLISAAGNGELDEVRTILDLYPEALNWVGDKGTAWEGSTALFASVYADTTSVMEFLLAKGAKVEAGQSGFATPLERAIGCGKKDHIRLLLAANAHLKCHPRDPAQYAENRPRHIGELNDKLADFIRECLGQKPIHGPIRVNGKLTIKPLKA